MGKVTWAPSALGDIDAIAEFISKDSVDRAAAPSCTRGGQLIAGWVLCVI